MNQALSKKSKIITRILDRLSIDKQESDQAYFMCLMYLGEHITKLYATTLIAGLEVDKDRHKYRSEHLLVRADGIGEWSRSINDLVSGRSSQFLNGSLLEIQRLLVQKQGNESWEKLCLEKIISALKLVDNNVEKLPGKISLKYWFEIFTRLRNSTRGHGAPSGETCSKMSLLLAESIHLLIENGIIFDLDWAYVRQNLSGKFDVRIFTEGGTSFEKIKDSREEWQPYLQNGDGMYVCINNNYFKANLLLVDLSVIDFYLPNGGYTKTQFELISYITGQKKYVTNSQYESTPSSLPLSESSSKPELDVIGNCFTNLPGNEGLYIKRNKLEAELSKIITDDRHPVITLVGRGGIGKTTTALNVLPEICNESRFDAIIWFSARDIDLKSEGVKPVKPDVLTTKDLAKMYVRLMEPKQASEKDFDSLDFMKKELGRSSFGRILFVMDNFETVANPGDVYNWLNTYIRLPNKLLITSRFREFKADYPIEVKGMDRPEFDLLVQKVSKELNIEHMLSSSYLNELFDESQGHPYIVKVLLGEVHKDGKTGKIKRILASRDEVLTALFERTFNALSPVAKRVFLTLANWRSTIPSVAIESVLMRKENEKMDVEAGIDELNRYSLIEIVKSQADNSLFLSLPLAAFEFGHRKLNSSPMKTAVETDMIMLHMFGVGRNTEIIFGLDRRIKKFFRSLAKSSDIKSKIKLYKPIIEYICRKHPKYWLDLSDFYQELILFPDAKIAARNYVESYNADESELKGWNRLYDLYRYTMDYQGQVNSLVEIAVSETCSSDELISCAGKVLSLFTEKKFEIDSDEKKVLVGKLVRVAEETVKNQKNKESDTMSTLAWLNIHLDNKSSAKEWTKKGLRIDPNHYHCVKLANILKLQK
jgi:hypothetical protein